MMNTIPITRKQLESCYRNIIKVPYGDLQYILSMSDAMFHNSGCYGWNYTVFEITRDTCICTGYRPIGNIESDYKYNEEMNNLAKEVRQARNLTVSQMQEKLNIIKRVYARVTIEKSKVK